MKAVLGDHGEKETDSRDREKEKERRREGGRLRGGERSIITAPSEWGWTVVGKEKWRVGVF